MNYADMRNSRHKPVKLLDQVRTGGYMDITCGACTVGDPVVMCTLNC